VTHSTVLFVHGMWADGACWARYRRVFSQAGYDTHALTLRGHETPQDPAWLRNVGIMDYVEQTASFVAGLPAKPILVGHSMGALVAQKLAESGLAKAIVLLASVAPGGVPCLTPSALTCISGNLLDIARARPFIMPPWHARFGLTNTLSRREQDVVQHSLIYESGLAMRQVVMGEIRVDETRVRCPVLVGVGGVDRATPPRVARGIARKYGADYHEYTGKCHFVAGDREILLDVLAWCNQLRSTD
jgi:pimeloyl-ACP methyl ester carboxylesterase